PNVGLQFPEPIGLQPISQNMKQQVAGQVRGRSPPERRVPFGSQFLDIEIAQTRDLGVERLSIRHRGIDHHAWHGRSTGATTRGAESGLCTATVDDAIDPLTVDLLRAQFKAELFAHHASEEAANRMLLPIGGTHNGGNRCSLRPAQHGEHASLFRPWPAFARGASFSLRLARAMPRANGRLRCNGSPLARGDDFDWRCFDLGPVGSRANACLRRGANGVALDADGFEALFGDAKGHRSSFSIASPGQERAVGADLFQQPSADELIHGLSNRLARNVRRQVDSAIIAPRSRGQNDALGIGEFGHRDPPSRWCGVIAATTTAPPRPCSRRGRIPRAWRARTGHSTVLFAVECQSFLDNVIARLGQTGSWNNPHLPAGLTSTAKLYREVYARHGSSILTAA